jgi:hypothetical protein
VTSQLLLRIMIITMFISGVAFYVLLIHTRHHEQEGWSHTTKKICAYLFMISTAYLVIMGLGSWVNSVYRAMVG